MPMKIVFRNALAKCPQCHGDTGRMWIGLFPGEKCPTCGSTLVYLPDDPNRPKDGTSKEDPNAS